MQDRSDMMILDGSLPRLLTDRSRTAISSMHLRPAGFQAPPHHHTVGSFAPNPFTPSLHSTRTKSPSNHPAADDPSLSASPAIRLRLNVSHTHTHTIAPHSYYGSLSPQLPRGGERVAVAAMFCPRTCSPSRACRGTCGRSSSCSCPRAVFSVQLPVAQGRRRCRWQLAAPPVASQRRRSRGPPPAAERRVRGPRAASAPPGCFGFGPPAGAFSAHVRAKQGWRTGTWYRSGPSCE